MTLNWFQRQKMEIKNPTKGYFNNVFPAICNNYCGVLAAWSRMTFKMFEKCLCILEKRPLAVKFLKFCSKSSHRDTDRRVVFKFREISPTGNRWSRALLTWQKIAWLSSYRYCVDRAQNLLRPAPNNVLRVLQISSKSVHFRRSYSPTREHRQNAP